MLDTDQIFAALEGPAKVAAIIGVTTEHAYAMKRRGSVPPAYWPPLIAEAARLGKTEITSDALAAIAARKRRRAIECSAARQVSR